MGGGTTPPLRQKRTKQAGAGSRPYGPIGISQCHRKIVIFSQYPEWFVAL